ncbi:hypothetical protein V6Z11_A07G065100 [Gossypium hirsutum]
MFYGSLHLIQPIFSFLSSRDDVPSSMLNPKCGSINCPLLSLFVPSHDLHPKILLSCQLSSLFPAPSSHGHMLFIDAALQDCALNDKFHPILAISTPSIIFASQKESLCLKRPQLK